MSKHKLYRVYQDSHADGSPMRVAVPQDGGLFAVSDELAEAIDRARDTFGSQLFDLLLALGAEGAERFEVTIQRSEIRVSGESKRNG